jgi:hypothetical protein
MGALESHDNLTLQQWLHWYRGWRCLGIQIWPEPLCGLLPLWWPLFLWGPNLLWRHNFCGFSSSLPPSCPRERVD